MTLLSFQETETLFSLVSDECEEGVTLINVVFCTFSKEEMGVRMLISLTEKFVS